MLTRVYSKIEGNYIKAGTIIDVKLAKKEFPNGKISSSNDQIFICKKCLEYVGFSIRKNGTPFFRHNPNHDNFCEDKISNNYGNSIDNYEKYIDRRIKFPLKLDINSIENFEKFKVLRFKIGFPFFEFMRRLDFSMSIKSKRYSWYDGDYEENTYTKEYIKKSGINYLSVGNNIVWEYIIEIDNNEIRKNIPNVIEGIKQKNTFFDSSNGNKISYGGNIIVNKKYFLLTKEDIRNSNDIELKKILNYQDYNLYEVKILQYSDESCEFIRDKKYFLVRDKSKFIPLWSSYTKEEYFLYLPNSSNKIFFTYYADNKENYFRVFYQKKTPKEFDIDNISVYNLSCLNYIDEYQFLSFGRDIESNFLTIEKIDFGKLNKDFLEIKVFDSLKDEKEIGEGVYYQLPFKRKLCLKNLKFDGFFEIISNNGFVKYKEEFNGRDEKEDIVVSIDNLQFGDTVNIYYGLDLVWSVKYEKKKDDNIDDEILYLELQKLTGKKISISHSIASIAMKMNLYPKTKNWFLKQIRKGFIIDKAFYKLKKIF